MEKTEGTGNYKHPTAAYLVYIGLDTNEQLVIQHRYNSNIGAAAIADTEEALMADAISSAPVWYAGENFDTIKFNRQRSYFSLVLDIENWEFYYPSPGPNQPIPGETHDPLVFVERKSPTGIRKDPNFSFYNATKIHPRNAAGTVRNGVRFTNFLTENANGDPLQGRQNFCFEIYIRAPFSKDPALAGEYITIIIDPDGQNQGPP
jgi:hypothetical protein